MYDKNNIFAKIIRREFLTDIIYEDDFTIVIPDIAPVAPIHILIIPKGNFQNYNDFVTNAPSEHLQHFFKIIAKITTDLGINDNYRLITNIGETAGQSIFHFHIHIISGKQLTNLI